MKQPGLGLKYIFSLFLFIILLVEIGQAQQYNCSFKEPVIKIDFGTSNLEKEINLSSLTNYNKSRHSCPVDGDYSFTSFASGCFNNNWHTLTQDHTPNDANGKMMVVNAALEPGTFFIYNIAGLKPAATYEISTWLVNICRDADGCIPTAPEIIIAIYCGGKKIASFKTGPIGITREPAWLRYSGIFTMPPGIALVTIKMDDITIGGCGNDFAMDDILIKECVLNQPPKMETPKPLADITGKAIPAQPKTVHKETSTSKVIEEPKPVPGAGPIEKETNAPIANITRSNPVIKNAPVNNNPVVAKPVIVVKPTSVPLPAPIATRANPIIKQIETEETDMIIELYDNGEIDGDTVSIYHNNQLIVYRAGLSEKPETVKIRIDKQHPHHELVMVADNLGSIPPNTSLMIITAKNNRYEIFISSSEQKNAKIVIDLKEQ